jgi:hypothetical protein
MLGYLYFHMAGEAYALVSIGLISFAAVAQFAPAMLGGMYWRGGTSHGAIAGLLLGFTLWVYTLMLPSIAKSGWLDPNFLTYGPWGIALLKPEQLLGLAGMDNLTHSLFWSLLANVAAYVAVSLWRTPSAMETSQALLFVDVFSRVKSQVARRPSSGSGTRGYRTSQRCSRDFSVRNVQPGCSRNMPPAMGLPALTRSFRTRGWSSSSRHNWPAPWAAHRRAWWLLRWWTSKPWRSTT